jgi:hypothetical protein
MESSDPYEILGASGLLRKLLLDSNPLIDQVNSAYRVRISFRISDFDIPHRRPELKGKLTFWSLQDGLDPDTELVGRSAVEITRDQFFSKPLLMLAGAEFSVREIILFEANIMGGIHAGSPKEDKERALASISNVYRTRGLRVPLRQLKSIARVVSRAIDPLYLLVKCSPRPNAK